VATVWEEQEVPTPQGKRLGSLAGKVAKIGDVLHEEAQSREQQRGLVDELHKDQMKRLDEISIEIDGSIADLAVYMDDFVRSSRGLLEGTFSGLHGDLRARIDGLLPRLRELEAKGRTVRAGIEEEKAARARETSEVLETLREQIEKLAADLNHEQKVRETRNAEIQSRMEAAVAAMDSALDTEASSREQRVVETMKDCQLDHQPLMHRQDRLEQGLESLRDEVQKEAQLEKEQRVATQDPLVQALTSFIQKFQLHAQEQSHLGN